MFGGNPCVVRAGFQVGFSMFVWLLLYLTLVLMIWASVSLMDRMDFWFWSGEVSVVLHEGKVVDTPMRTYESLYAAGDR
jgi:hypothetical protein